MVLKELATLGKIYWIGFILEWAGLGLAWNGVAKDFSIGLVLSGEVLLLVGVYRWIRSLDSRR